MKCLLIKPTRIHSLVYARYRMGQNVMVMSQQQFSSTRRRCRMYKVGKKIRPFLKVYDTCI